MADLRELQFKDIMSNNIDEGKNMDSFSNLGPRYPTTDEQQILRGDLSIVKLMNNDGTNLQPFYFRWRDVWDDNIRVYKSGTTRPTLERTLRLAAFSLPAYWANVDGVNDAGTVPAYFYVINEGYKPGSGDAGGVFSAYIYQENEVAFW